MNVLMYPIAPEDEFPDEFCAIRQGSGEHWFYVPEGESASWMLFRAESENAKLRNDADLLRAMLSQVQTEKRCYMAENAKLRELVAKYSAAAKYLCGFSHCNECNLDCASVFGDVPSGWDCARMLLDKKARELGVEVGE